MPAVAIPAFWYAVAAGGTSAAAVYGARSAARSARRAGDIEERAANEALEFERENETRRRQEYEDERRRAWQLEDEDRQFRNEDRQFRNEDRLFNRGEYQKREQRLTPYRAFGAEGVANLRSLLQPNAAAPSLRVGPSPSPDMALPLPKPSLVATASMPSRYQNFADLMRPRV